MSKGLKEVISIINELCEDNPYFTYIFWNIFSHSFQDQVTEEKAKKLKKS